MKCYEHPHRHDNRTSPYPYRLVDADVKTDPEIWLQAWLVVAGTFNAKLPDCDRYADHCLAEFRKRFPKSRTIG